MAPPVAQAVAAGIEEQASPTPVDVVWHGGEPLALGHRKFQELCEVFEPLRSMGALRHYVQTNASLIDDEWCSLFVRYGFNVGVSIDGPESATSNRVNWSGRPAYARIMKGIHALKRNDIGYSAICVVTSDTIRSKNSILDFFEKLQPQSIGFNIEETEGANYASERVSNADARQFWAELLRRIDGGSQLASREYGRLFSYLRDTARGGESQVPQVHLDPIPTISWDGDVVVLSPELLGTQSPTYHDFVIGNLAHEGLTRILARAAEAPYVNETLTGIDNCQRVCEFFGFCRGGAS